MVAVGVGRHASIRLLITQSSHSSGVLLSHIISLATAFNALINPYIAKSKKRL